MKDRTGVIFDIKRYAIHDGPGIRTTVFFKGCPLDCWWCHNPEGKNPGPERFPGLVNRRGVLYVEDGLIGKKVDCDLILKEVVKDRIFYDESGGGATISGGEPLMQPEFLVELLIHLRNEGIKAILDTSGYAEFDTLKGIIDLVDVFYYDLKLIDEEAHIKYTGVSNRLILDNLQQLIKNGARVVPRVSLIPGITDTDENLRAVLSVLEDLQSVDEVGIIPYNIMRDDKVKRFNLDSRLGKLEQQPEERLKEIRVLFDEAGIRVKLEG